MSPLCADAYVLLAEEEARSGEEVLDYYQQGVEAGEMALGSEGFEEYAGHFWGCLLYTSDAADERSSVDLGGRRIIKKKTRTDHPTACTQLKINTYTHHSQ